MLLMVSLFLARMACCNSHFTRRSEGAGHARNSRVSGEEGSTSRRSTAEFHPSLVIFDKDGTMVDCDSVWLHWMELHVQDIQRATGLDLSERLYSSAGYCRVKEQYHPNSLLAQATLADVRRAFRNVLVEAGIPEPKATTVIEECCPDFDSGNASKLEVLGNLPHIFEVLRYEGIKIAVCTSDSRCGTESTLDTLRLTHLVDKVVCGDDRNSTPKPAPDNALHICDALQALPGQTAVVGDTLADAGMGRSAGLGLIIGVLSGAGTRQQLEPETDIILNNIDGVLDVLLPNSSQTNGKRPPSNSSKISSR